MSLRQLCITMLITTWLAMISAAQCPTQKGSDNFSGGEGQMASIWTPTITSSGINLQAVPSLTLLHNGVVANPRQVPYGLSSGTLSSDQQNPKALWNATIPDDQYVEVVYKGGVAYSELFAGSDPGNTTPRWWGMTGDAFGDLTFENVYTGNSFIAPDLDSSAWSANPFNIHPSTNGYFDLVLRCDPVGRAKCYTLRIYPGSSSWAMYAGTSVIGSGALSTRANIGDVFSFMVSRTTLSARQNGVGFASVTNRSYKSGQAGIGLNLIDITVYGFQAPLVTNFSVGTSGSTVPTISSVSPTSLLVGFRSQNFYANGSNVGACGGLVTHFSPSTGIAAPPPAIVNANQLNLLPAIDVNAPAGTYNVSLISPAGVSNQVPFTVVAPTYMVVNCGGSVCDHVYLCSGCSQSIMRQVMYQVMYSNGQPAASIPIGEVVSDTGWNCGQPEPPKPYTVSCTAPSSTDSYGYFDDIWTMGEDGYGPGSCGWNSVDHWQVCGFDLNGNVVGRTFATLNGFLHWDAIQLNGFTSTLANQNPIPKGTVIVP